MKSISDEFSIALDDSLISDFRDTVNELDFVYNYYHNIEGKNLFNPICSCMDWINVSVRYIRNFPELSGDLDVKAMQVYSLISAIDIIAESVGQLHKAITGDPKLKNWPFKGSNHVFKEKVEHLSRDDDDNYFKQIRATFGAHPTNLSPNPHERMFASWPYDLSTAGSDFTVSLYSNIPDKPDVYFGIKIAELLEFAKERYEHLKVLSEVILNTRRDYFLELSKKTIPATSNVYDELQVLLVATGERQDNDYYRMLIGELISLFDACIKEPHLQQEAEHFKTKLLPIIHEIRCHLQTMNLDELKTTKDVLVSRVCNQQIDYVLGKMFTWLHSGKHDPLARFYFDQLNKYSEGRYNFNASDDDDTTLLKLRMMLFHFHVLAEAIEISESERLQDYNLLIDGAKGQMKESNK